MAELKTISETDVVRIALADSSEQGYTVTVAGPFEYVAEIMSAALGGRFFAHFTRVHKGANYEWVKTVPIGINPLQVFNFVPEVSR